jgi:NAD+ synthase (glutamine-hydrolysing)
MRIALAQQDYHIGNFEENGRKIIEAVRKAKANGVDLIVFPELAVCGYPPRDFLEFNDFIRLCNEVVYSIAAETQGIAVIVGSPAINTKPEGKDLFNAAYFLQDGKIERVVHKALLPTYDVFDEYRYFEPGKEFNVIEYKGKKIALTVCEDLWNVGNENPLYMACPMDVLTHQQPDFIVNISASPFDYRHADDRIRVLKANTSLYKAPIFYVNHVGAQTELIFDGGSLVLDANGRVVEELPYFEEAYREYELDNLIASAQTSQPDNVQPKNKIGLMHDALVLGIKDYFRKLGFKQAILGLSGGIDSALVLVLAAEALGPENVWPIMLPSRFSSDHSINDSIALCQNLGVKVDKISIEEPFEAFLGVLGEHFKGLPFNLAEENMQARSRAVILMAMSNKFGHILLNTSNKSEASVGYGTLYGDMCGGISVIGDVYKTEVFQMCEFINRNGEIIPRNIITKPPSAELRPDQKDSDSLPEYDILDQVLYQYIEYRKGPKEIVAMGFDEALVKRILRLVNINEYKRHQTPPILRVSPKAFGVGRRMPIVGKYLG